MAIVHNLAGTVREKEVIEDIMIPELKKSLVAQYGVTVEEDFLATKSIKIWGVGDVTTSGWDGGAITYSDHTNSALELLLDYGTQFGQTTNNVDTTGATVDVLAAVLEKGGYKMATDIDTDVFTGLEAAATAGTVIADVDDTNVKGLFTEAQVLNDNADVPANGRVAFVTPEVSAALSDVVAGLGNDALAGGAIREGYVGFYKGFEIFKSTNLPAGTNLITTMKPASVLGLGYATVDSAPVPNQPQIKSYGAIQYGFKVVKPEAIFKFKQA